MLTEIKGDALFYLIVLFLFLAELTFSRIAYTSSVISLVLCTRVLKNLNYLTDADLSQSVIRVVSFLRLHNRKGMPHTKNANRVSFV